MQWICVHRHGTVHITILTHDLVGDRWLKCTRCVTSRVEPCIFESSGLTSSFCWVFCVEREHCFILEIRWCNERIQLEWKCFTECGRESIVATDKDINMKSVADLVVHFDASHIWHFVLICCIKRRSSVLFLTLHLIIDRQSFSHLSNATRYILWIENKCIHC